MFVMLSYHSTGARYKLSQTMDLRVKFLLCGLIAYSIIAIVLLEYRANHRFEKSIILQNPHVFAENVSIWNFEEDDSTRNPYLNTKDIRIKSVEFIKLENYTEIVYPEFETLPPRFSTDAEKTIFLKDPDNSNSLAKPSKVILTGQIHVIKNGFVRSSIDCGWRSDVSLFRWTGQATNKQYHVLLPMLVPDGGYFQHFIDGVLPKLAQSYHLIQQPNVKLLLPMARDPSVKKFLKMMGISLDKVVFDQGSSYYADELILTCITPPLHPLSFKTARGLLGVQDHNLIPHNESLVIFISRVKTRNPGRHITNFPQIQNLLQSRYGKRLYIFTGRESTEETISLFSKAKIVFGVHGGGFCNILFAPVTTVVIEVMPINESGHVPRHLAHTMIWRLARMFGQSYWRIFESALTAHGDVRINENKLIYILNRVDN